MHVNRIIVMNSVNLFFAHSCFEINVMHTDRVVHFHCCVILHYLSIQFVYSTGSLLTVWAGVEFSHPQTRENS